MRNLELTLLFAAMAVLPFTSCEKESSTQSTSANYIVSLRTQASSEETADYLLTTDDLMSGEITAEGQGIELIGWNYAGHFGGSYFAIGYELNQCIGYKENNGVLTEQGKLAFERMDLLCPIDDASFLAIGAPWGGGAYNCQFQVVDVEGVSISKTVEDPIYESYYHVDSTNADVQLNAWPTSAYVDGDRLFVSFYPLVGTTWQTPNTDTAYISIYSYPEMEYINTIKDSRTSPIGYYGSQPSIIADESGNHYTISTASLAAGYTQSTKPSGILRVNAGSEEFDTSYFFDVEASGYKVLTAAYAGNNKVVANVIKAETDIASYAWAAFSATSPLLYTAVLDLSGKTLSLVSDVPAHGGQYRTPMLVVDGMVYISVNNGTEAYVYQVDAANVAATRGAKIIGNELQGIFLNE